MTMTFVIIVIIDNFTIDNWQFDMVSLKVMVGDLVKVEDQQQIPADLLLFSSSLRWHSSFNCHPMTIRQHHRNHHRNLHQRSGGCFVMTANLDGETNLKPLSAPKWEFYLKKKCFSLRKSVPSVSDKKKVCKNFRETRELITPQSLGQLEAQVIFPYAKTSIRKKLS